jgi:hypothetical protein
VFWTLPGVRVTPLPWLGPDVGRPVIDRMSGAYVKIPRAGCDVSGVTEVSEEDIARTGYWESGKRERLLEISIRAYFVAQGSGTKGFDKLYG